MNNILVDSSVILDIFEDNADWADWSENVLNELGANNFLCINPIIYAEISIGFKKIEELEDAIGQAGFHLLQLPKEALFLAGKAFLKYRRQDGSSKTSPLPDFYIGAHAAVEQLKLITRDTNRIKHYFPTVSLVSPSVK
jgi:predicted nucleic acid-binding protein